MMAKPLNRDQRLFIWLMLIILPVLVWGSLGWLFWECDWVWLI